MNVTTALQSPVPFRVMERYRKEYRVIGVGLPEEAPPIARARDPAELGFGFE